MRISYKAIGRNMYRARKAAGMTQEQAAEMLEMSIVHYGRMERGERRIALEQIADAAQVFEISKKTLQNVK